MSYVYQLLKPVARDQRVSLAVIQQDYAVSFLLAGMAQTPGLGEKIALKGGSALKKLCYRDYRFTDELDFSTLTPGALPDGDALMQTAAQAMTALLKSRGEFEVWVEPLPANQPEAGQPVVYLVRVRFPDERLALCRLRVEITVKEPRLLPVQSHPILHEYSEPFAASMQGAALAEIAAEKLCTLLQSQEDADKAGLGASRICQDYYDLWFMLGREKLSGVPGLVAQKCAARGMAFSSPEAFVSPGLYKTARHEWNQQLTPFLYRPPLAERVLQDTRSMIVDLFREG